MSSLEEHEVHSLKMLGKPWTEIHSWLDQYFVKTPGVAHRVVLHHRLGIELGVAKFGEQARAALELHIQDDFELIPETPEEVVMIVANQDLMSLTDIDVLQPVLDELYPGLPSLLWEELAVMRFRGK